MNITRKKIIIASVAILAFAVVGIAVFFLLSYLDPSGRSGNQQDPAPSLSEASDAKQRGEEEYDKGDFEAARGHYQEALELYKEVSDQTDQVADIEVQLSLIEHELVSQKERKAPDDPGPAGTGE